MRAKEPRRSRARRTSALVSTQHMRCALTEDVASAAPFLATNISHDKCTHRVDHIYYTHCGTGAPMQRGVGKQACTRTHKHTLYFTSHTLKASTSSSEKPFFLNRAGAVSRAEGWCPAVGGICVVGAGAAGAVWKNSSEMVWIAGGERRKRKKRISKKRKGSRIGSWFHTTYTSRLDLTLLEI